MLVGGGVLLLVPVLVLHALGQKDVGFYRAASAISITYLGFLLNSMAQDYYPRVSAVNEQPSELSRLVNEQLRLVLLLGGPVILGMLALVPYLVPLIYSEQFAPTIDLLEWQLIGDLFKLSSWTMAFVILARNGSGTFFMTELCGGALMLVSSWLGMRWFGLSGLGVGFVLTSAAYCLICWGMLRRSLGLCWTTTNMLLFAILVAATLVVRALPYVGLGNFRSPIALGFAALAGLGSLYIIWGEMGGWKNLLAWGRTRLPRVSDT
jgi:PST family polysaccharide transporter